MKKIIFIGELGVSTKYLAQAVISLGYEPVFFTNSSNLTPQLHEIINQYEIYEVDINSIDDIQRIIKENPEKLNKETIHAVTAILDVRLRSACILAKELGVLGPDKALIGLASKWQVFEFIPTFSPKTISFTIDNIPYDKIHALLTDKCEEVIIKPVDSFGAVGVFTANEDQINKIYENIINLKINNSKQLWIAQEKIKGSLFSLEGFILDGKINFLGFSRRARISLTEVTNHFPADNALSSGIRFKCKNAVSTLVKKSSIKNGYFHCEFIVTEGDCFLIDANMGRIAGGAISEQIALYFNKSPVKIFCHVVDVGLFSGRKSTINFYNPKNISLASTLSIHYGLPVDSVFVELELPPNSKCMHTQFLTKGTQVDKLGKNYHGHVAAIAGYTVEVKDEIDRIKIITSKGPHKPFYIIDEDGFNTKFNYSYHHSLLSNNETSMTSKEVNKSFQLLIRSRL